ncbi:MAG: RluA family pseudouridine synthase [Oligoflexia bacterium]|nr:RluA family pseudouridine synthase [Oligoflexia bacterium]
MKKSSYSVKGVHAEKDSQKLIEVIAAKVPISKVVIKKVFTAGGAWLKKKGRRELLRVRRADTLLAFGDAFEFYYDQDLLEKSAPLDECFVLEDNPRFCVWFKASGVLSQGTKYGDHCSLLRHLEVQTKREIFLIHRLDREVSGLMVFAYTRDAARRLSMLWSQNLVEKRYLALVYGHLKQSEGEITFPLDGKSAKSIYKVRELRADMTTLVEIKIISGRLHQIRRHMQMIGHPVVGDREHTGTDARVIERNKDWRSWPALAAISLSFSDPWGRKESDKRFHYEIDESLYVSFAKK